MARPAPASRSEDDAVLNTCRGMVRPGFSEERRDRHAMSDRTLTCRDCGTTFVFTASEQAFYTERGFTDAQRCPACRAARKAQRNSNTGYGGGYSSGPR